MTSKEKPKEDINATRVAEPSQVSEAGFIADDRDVDPEATLIDGRPKKAQVPVASRPVVEDDEPEATRIDSKPPVAPRAAVAPVSIEPPLDDEATRIQPPRPLVPTPRAGPAIAAPAARASEPSPPAPAKPPARVPTVWLALLGASLMLLVTLALLRATRGPRPEDLKPLHSVEVKEEKGALRSLFDW